MTGCFEYGFEYQGETVMMENATSSEICQELCGNNPPCAYFTYFEESSLCHLKGEKGIKGRTKNDSAISGPVSCHIPDTSKIEVKTIISFFCYQVCIFVKKNLATKYPPIIETSLSLFRLHWTSKLSIWRLTRGARCQSSLLMPATLCESSWLCLFHNQPTKWMLPEEKRSYKIQRGVPLPCRWTCFLRLPKLQ